MSRAADLVLAVVSAPPGLLLVHRPGELPPVILPGGRPEPKESPGATAERGTLSETRVRIRAGRQIGRLVEDGIATIYVAATPVEDVPADTLAVSLSAAWYDLDQVRLVLPDLWAPVRHHLLQTLHRP